MKFDQIDHWVLGATTAVTAWLWLRARIEARRHRWQLERIAEIARSNRVLRLPSKLVVPDDARSLTETA